MDLQEFIATTLRQIIDGVIEAQAYGKPKGAYVNKCNLWTLDNAGKPHSVNYRCEVEHAVDFDVAVTVAESNEKGAQAGIKLAVFNANAGGTGSSANTTISRIRFKVGVVLPPTLGSQQDH